MQSNAAEDLDQTMFKEVDKAYLKIERLFEYYGMQTSDFKFFMEESPNLMKRINELEETIGPPMSDSEVIKNLESWIKNWDAVFRRRRGKKQVMNYG